MTAAAADPELITAKRAELEAVAERIRTRKAELDEDFGVRRGLLRDLIGLGVRKAELARWAGVTHAMVNDAIGKH